MSLLALALLISKRAVTCATPILSHSSPEILTPSQGSLIDIISSGSTGACTVRSQWDILWSCWATTFICTWVTAHPNIPIIWGSHQSLLSVWRFYFAFLAIFAPEILVLWAFKQFQGALVIKGILNMRYGISDEPGELGFPFLF